MINQFTQRKTDNLENSDQQKQKILLITGPSGVGKSTMINKIREEYQNQFEPKISHTSRQPRVGEKDGINYYFLKKEKFEKLIQQGNFLEYDFHFGNYYGTSKSEIDRIESKNMIPILDIDINGSINLIKNQGKHYIINKLFLKTTNIEELRERLQKRGTESVENINERIQRAQLEIQKMEESNLYKQDEIIISTEVEETFSKIQSKLQQFYQLKQKK